MQVPFLHLKKHNLLFKEEYHKALDKCLNNGNFILGDEVKLFEKEFNQYIGSSWSIGVSNCHDGLELILRTSNIGKGDEVILPSNTFIATWLAILNVGATPIPVEPSLETYNINPKAIQENISSKTKAIIVVHLYGAVCEMDEIKNIANKNKLLLFEDAAQSIGSKYKGVKTGSLGDAASFSFYPSKNLGALGDSGIVTTSNKILANKVSKLRNYGSAKKYNYNLIGKNCRLDEIQAAFLRIKLKNIDKENILRNQLAEIYFSRLESLQYRFSLPQKTLPSNYNSWHLFVLLTSKRNLLHKYLLEKGINTLFHYPIAPHQQECFKGTKVGNLKLPISEEIHNKCISLPISSQHTQREINYVCDNIEKFFKEF